MTANNTAVYSNRGLFISILDRGHVRSILDNWPETNVAVRTLEDEHIIDSF